MTDVPPYHKIEPQAQPWARWVTNGIQRVSGAVESLRTNLKSQGEVAAAQMNRLQDQIADLAERRTYSLSIPVSLSTTTPGAYEQYVGSARIDFTLRKRSLVRVSGSALLSGWGIGANSSVTGSIGMYVDNYPMPYPSELTARMSGFSSVANGAGNIDLGTTVYFSTTLELDAGDHFARPLDVDTYCMFIGTSGRADLDNIFFQVDVLGLA